jgi:hypothetical protein
MSQEPKKDMSQYIYRASAADFMKIPGSPVAYWVSKSSYQVFADSPAWGKMADARQGLATADNQRFLRLWYEVSLDNFEKSCRSRLDVKNTEKKWFPYNKGGVFRKWYGNQEYLVNWKNDGEELEAFRPRSVIRNPDYYFKESVSWSDVTSSSNAFRYYPEGFIHDSCGHSVFNLSDQGVKVCLSFCNNKFASKVIQILNPTMHFHIGYFESLPYPKALDNTEVKFVDSLIQLSKFDWNAYETSWDFVQNPLLGAGSSQQSLSENYRGIRANWQEMTTEMQHLEEKNNRIFIEAYGLQDELTPDVPLEEITLTCNPHYRYGGNRSEEELETLLQCDTLKELVSYAIGCMMSRYAIDKPGLILASQGETLEDYIKQIPSPRFMPDEDAILPLTDQEWFPDDATNRFREFVRVVWGDEHLQENLDFVAESLCLHAIKPKRGESALDTIRRYLSAQFFKDHMRTYKKRPIYWLFSSGKQKAFECLVYLHRYNEGTLARMRTEYVIPLTAKMAAYAQKLQNDKEASSSAAEIKRIEKELTQLHKKQAELSDFDEKLRHYADQRISLDLDDGVKVNYCKFGDLLAEVKAITGKNPN